MHDALLACAKLAADATGMPVERVRASAVRRAVAPLVAAGLSPEELLRRALRADAELEARLLDGVTVGETYLYRHPEQFSAVHQRLRAAGHHTVRAWSAGCATGEEAWSLVGCLRGAFDVDVLGTDVIAARFDAARAATYGRWSVRHPPLEPLLVPAGADRWVVRPDLRPFARFRVHNLLNAPPEGYFSVIFCRNVLIYLDAVAARRVVAHLTSALAEGGICVFGSGDLPGTPPGLERVAAPGLQMYTAAAARRVPATVLPSAPAPARPSPSAPPRPDPVAHLLEALRCIEAGDRDGAHLLLDPLCRPRHPYLPAVLERALLFARHGELEAARVWMTELRERARELPDTGMVEGPETLPVSFYRTRASDWLARHRR